MNRIADLPKGSAPAPLTTSHFPTPLHAFVWRNWSLVPLERIAQTVGATAEDIRRIGTALGLSGPPPITADQQRRSYITVIRRNWHLLPYEQLLTLLGWTPEQMAYTLREDDFLYVKLGNLKPQCPPIHYQPSDAATQQREATFAARLHQEFPQGVGQTPEPLFAFVSELTRPTSEPPKHPASTFSPRYCYSYFALYGDPLLETESDPYPEGYLSRLAAQGVDGVWLQAVLYKLAPFPWNPALSDSYEKRLERLKALVARARKYGIGLYLYLNEPRAMPLAFFEAHPELKGVVEGDHAVLCTSVPAVRDYLTRSVETICRAVPDLAGLFTISASENLTSCWSHHHGEGCPRCRQRSPMEVIAEVNTAFYRGIQQAGSQTRLIVWDWGWKNEWAEETIRQLPPEVALMSVSEWDIPVQRGGVESIVGEYSLSTIGPGPRALRHWDMARERGMKTLAKIQTANTWELSAVPYLPVVANVAEHIARLRQVGVTGLMLGWTLGGYPCSTLQVITEMTASDQAPLTPDEAMKRVAVRQFGSQLAPTLVEVWKEVSAAFQEFPYHGAVVYNAPLQMGPANLLWEKPTGYRATMVGIPYDDLDAWRAVYPAEVFIQQMDRVAQGFEAGVQRLVSRIPSTQEQSKRLTEERNVLEAAAIHFRSVANQARFVSARNALVAAPNAKEAAGHRTTLQRALQDEIDLAKRLYALQSRDSRLGFEATNHYFYIPLDLAEKVMNCHDLLERWLPSI